VASIKLTTCNLCEAMCGLAVTVEGGRVTSIEGDREDVFSRGHICPKGPAMRELLEDPDRVRRPLRRRVNGAFEEVSWDSALSEAAERIAAVQKTHGMDAAAFYYGNPTVHDHGSTLMSVIFGLVLGTKNRYDSNSVDANPRLFACERMFGDITAIPVPDIDRTDYLLMIGANPLASGGSIMSLGDVRGRIKGVRQRGGALVVVDPRRTETAQVASLHVPIRPGTDAALVLGILHVIFSKGFVDEAAVGRIATGLGDLRAAVTPFTPQRVARATGVDAATIVKIAVDFASAKRAVAYSRVGVCHSVFGATASWLVDALNVVTGNFDRPGGAMFTSPAVDLGPVARWLGVSGAGRFRSRVRGLPEVGGTLPCATLADEIETPGPGQIRALVTLAGNPVSSVPNGERLRRALGGLDFMVSIDIYVNETTRHASLILPPRPALARGHYDLLLSTLAVRNFAKWSDPVVPPEPGSKDDWEILRELAKRLARARGGLSKVAAAALGRFGDLSSEQVMDLLLRLGPYGDKMLPFRDGLSLEKLRRQPHGVDLGPLVPMREKRVRKPDAKVDLCCPEVLVDLRRVDAELDRPAEGLVLIGRRHVRSNNSWMHNCPSLVKGPDRTALYMHPTDAASRGLTDGAQARVKSRVGEVVARVKVTDEVMAGVVSLPHGFGQGAAKETLRVAGALGAPGMNVLTDDAVVEPLTGSAVLTGVSVSVEAAR
jgi:anaerobic selenocysteine-containing dehydrogenase